MKRPSWDEFWFLQALMYSTRATCDRLRTAAVLVDEDNLFISAGYNGSVSGTPHCDDVGHLMIEGHCIRSRHGEANAVNNAIDIRRLRGASVYLVYSPCVECAKLLIDKGVKRILYINEFTNMTEEEKRFISELVVARSVVLQKVDIDPKSLIKNAVKIFESKGGAFYSSKQKGE